MQNGKNNNDTLRLYFSGNCVSSRLGRVCATAEQGSPDVTHGSDSAERRLCTAGAQVQSCQFRQFTRVHVTVSNTTLTRLRELTTVHVADPRVNNQPLCTFPCFFQREDASTFAHFTHLNQSDQVRFQDGAHKLQETHLIGGQSFVYVGSYPRTLLHLRNFLPASQHALHAIFDVLMCLTCHNCFNAGRSRRGRFLTQNENWPS